MYNNIVVGMADFNVVKHQGILTTFGLGSCIGIALYDSINKIAGLAHIMLPSSKLIKNNNKAKFADTATLELLDDMKKLGASKYNIKAKIVGGAQMFSFNSTNENMRIGDRNIEATIKILSELCIPIVAKDVGDRYGRTIHLYTDDGRILIKTVENGNKII